MTTYKIGGKDYELESETTMGGTGLEFDVRLVASDGETIVIFADSYEPYNNEPEDHYAGNGMFWDEIHEEVYDSNGHLTPAPNENAKKLTAEEWAEYAASNLTENNWEHFEWPELDDDQQMKNLKDEVWDTVKNQYEDMCSTLIENAIKRGEIDPPTEVFICEVGQDYGVPCLIARNGTERHTLIVNIYRRVRDKDYDRAALIEEAKEAFTLPNCELDEDGLDYLLSEIEGRLAADKVVGDN